MGSKLGLPFGLGPNTDPLGHLHYLGPYREANTMYREAIIETIVELNN